VKRARSWQARAVARERECSVALSTSRAVAVCLFAGQGMATKRTKKVGGRVRQGWIRVALPFVLRVKRSRSVSCSAGGECLSVKDVSCSVLRCRRRTSFFCPVRIRAATSNCRRAVGHAVCVVRTSSRLTTGHTVQQQWMSEQSRETRQTRTHTQTTYDSHDAAKAKDYGARRPGDDGA